MFWLIWNQMELILAPKESKMVYKILFRFIEQESEVYFCVRINFEWDY